MSVRCNITEAAPQKNDKNENDVKTAARAQWPQETKARNKSFALTLNANVCSTVGKKGIRSLSHEHIYKCKPRWCFWRNIYPDLTVNLECEVWLRYEITANPSGALEEESWRRRASNLHPTQTSPANLTRGDQLRCMEGQKGQKQVNFNV